MVEVDDSSPRYSPYPPSPEGIPELLCCSVHVGFLHPFRLLTRQGDSPWAPTLRDINEHTYDYVRLGRLVGALDCGLANPFNVVVGVDGAIAVPAIEQFTVPETALAFVNRQLAAILIGGIYCQANSLQDLEAGRLIDWEFLRLSGSSSGKISHFHNSARLLCMSGQECLNLLEPPINAFREIYEAHSFGRNLLSRLRNLTPEILLQAITSVVNRNWSDALANIWISIEQLTTLHWNEWVEAKHSETFPARKRQFEDVRTWTTALRQEMLFQMNKIDALTLESLFTARQARNALAHSGKVPDKTVLSAALKGLEGLMAPFSSNGDIRMFKIDLAEKQTATPRELANKPIEDPKYWRSIPFYPREQAITQRYRKEMDDITSGRRPRSPPIRPLPK